METRIRVKSRKGQSKLRELLEAKVQMQTRLFPKEQITMELSFRLGHNAVRHHACYNSRMIALFCSNTLILT